MAERPNQRRRTRKDLLDAAGRLARAGRTPTLDEVAEEALVSRATAYRYFPSVEALLAEAAVHIAFPDPDEIFAGAGADPAERVERLDRAMDGVIIENEPSLRIMLSKSLERADGEGLPARQNRRSPLIEAALAPARRSLKDGDLLAKALALVIGTESRIVCKDVLQLEDAEARAVKDWAIRALVAAAQKAR